MKNKIYISLILVLALVSSVFIFAPASASDIKATAAAVSPEKIVEAKIENILNLNNVFGDDFTNNEILVNKAAVNLKNYADEDGFIDENIVISYIKDMYDIDLVITDSINSEMPKKEGCVYLIPRGYTSYTHKIKSITEENGNITVISEVAVDYHDDSACIGTAKTILVKNPNSSFGYNIINCEMTFDSIVTNI